MQAGLLNTYQGSISSRGLAGWLAAALLFVFYLVIYFTGLLDPLAHKLGLASRWNLYGIMYTLAIVIGAIYFLRRHGNSRYHRIRTISIVFFQVVFAFSIPALMELFQMQGFTFSIFWPLKIDYFYPAYILKQPLPLIVYAFLSSLILVPLLTFFFGKRWYCSWACGCGGLAETAGEPFRHLSNKKAGAWKFEQIAMNLVIFFAILATALVMINWSTGVTLRGDVVTAQAIEEVDLPAQGQYLVLYGSGTLAHPYDGKSIWQPTADAQTDGELLLTWQSVWCDSREIDHTQEPSHQLDLAAGSIQARASGPGSDGQMFGTWASNLSAGTVEVAFPRYPTFSKIVGKVQGAYGFVIVALLSGVFGVGLYPLLGSRVWCRFFCPLAGLMGWIQKFGRFRITVKDDMCISCGNCSTYCEMGIDVRMYAQNNLSFKRAACVGCGICAHVCPRGVLRLENKFDLSPAVRDSNIRAFDL